MHLVQLAGFYSPTSGGLRVVVDQLGEYYASVGVRRTVVLPGPRDVVRPGRVELAAPLLPNHSGYRVVASRRRLLTVLNRLTPDGLEVHDKLMLRWVSPWARSRGIPIVGFTHERLDETLPLFAPRLPRAVTRGVAERIARGVARDCDRLIACSRYAAAEFDGVRDVDLVRLGVDGEHFRPRPRAASGRLELVLVSRLSAEKRPDLALAALAELVHRGVDARLTVLGNGPMQERLAERAGELPVRFAGFLPREQVAGMIARADVAVVPGPAETFGLAALESLASGVPVVCVRDGAVAELLAPGAGETCSPTAEGFADGITRLVLRPEAERRAAARASAAGRTWDAAGAAVLTVHRNAADDLRRVGDRRPATVAAPDDGCAPAWSSPEPGAARA